MPYTRRYNVEETLCRIQELDSDNSGSDDGDKEEVDNAEDEGAEDPIEVVSSGSASSDESDLESLRKRMKMPHAVGVKLTGTSVSHKRRGCERGRGSHAGKASSVPVVRTDQEVVGKSNIRIIETILNKCSYCACTIVASSIDGLDLGKDGTTWTLLDDGEKSVRRAVQNVLRHAPGPTREAKSKISTVLDAFKCIIDFTMITWLVNYTQQEAQR